MTVFSLTTMLSAGLAHAEKCNFFKKAPAIEVSFTLILFGDVSADIDATATENDPLVDPFTYVNQHQQSSYCGLHTCASTVTVTVIGPANNRETKVVFNGTNPIQPSYTYSYGGGTNPHFG
ncbi:MAG TPA: hypothetical protein VGS58_01955, partial [Candidatus Sulfopaludibacter sp.]|nr:hypothetical protein [Candidatus Sulfopaludibacter sp.]